ncbi:MAG: helix-turn-helix domain-containing protein [Spirochaetales bacterium]|nr:helix-turn-helix domain-containing protein [Spirochaetales bacterium]
MLDPLFPVSIECLTSAGAPTVVSGGEHLIAFLAEGRLIYKYAAERGVLEAGRLFMAGEELAATLTLQRASVLRLVRFSRAFRERLAVLFYEPDFLDAFFPPPGVSGATRPVILTPGDRLQAVRELFDHLSRENDERPCHYRLMIECRLTELLVLLARCREGPDERPEPAGRSSGLAAIVSHIEEHYTDEFSLEDLAARAGLAPAYFSRRFHEKTGTPLFEFINSIRVRKACQLLKRTDLPIIEIAYAVGYNNLSHFNRYFRKLMRVSPREYKNL